LEERYALGWRQESEVRGRKSEIRGQKTDVGFRIADLGMRIDEGRTAQGERRRAAEENLFPCALSRMPLWLLAT
jgi:hypothetical protein